MGRVTMTLIALVKASIASVTLFLRDLKPLSWKKAALENGTGPSYLPGADKLSQEEKDKLLRMKFFGGWKMFWTIYECMSDNSDLKIGMRFQMELKFLTFNRKLSKVYQTRL